MGPPLRREAGRERWLGKLRRRCGTAAAPIFLPLRPPVGPDGTAPKHSCFCAPEMFCPLQGVTPVTGVRGKGEYGHAVSILSRPPAILWFLSHRWERNSPPAGGETPLRTTNAVRNLPPHPAPSGPPSPQGEGLKKQNLLKKSLMDRNGFSPICFPTLYYFHPP